MRANLDDAGGLPLAERVAALLAPALGRLYAHDLITDVSARAFASGSSLAAALGAPDVAGRLRAAGVTREQVESALDPATYLGATRRYVDSALAAHQEHVGQYSP
jgi:3-carboxy-cis,cis-muconate cycloisomerase